MSENRLDIRVIENSEEERKRIITPVLNGYKTQFYSAFKNFEEKGVFDVIGTQLDITTYGKLTKEGWKSLHAAMSIYRNKNFETFRYLFIDKYGNLQDQCAVSCRMPNTSVNGPTETFLYNLITYAEQKDYYIAICHNHPSGNPTPSNEDIMLTSSINKGLTRTDGLNRFLGHIILDHDTFTVAVPSRERGIVWHEWDQTHELPDYEKDIDFELFGAYLNSYNHLVDAAKKINDTESWNDEYIPVLFSDGKLKSIQYFSYEIFLNEPELIKDTLKNSAILTGATQWFPVFTEHASKKISKENLFMIEQNCIKLAKINGATDISFCKDNDIFTICEKYGLGPGLTPELFFDRNNIKIETQTTFTVPEIDEKMFPFLKNIKANNLTAAESVVKENTPEYKTVDDIPSEYLAKRTDKLSAKLLWERLGNISIDDNENIDEPFIFFEKGTDRFEIWHWFEEHYNVSIAEELMYTDFMTKEEEKMLLNSINSDKTKIEKSPVEKDLRKTFTDDNGNPLWLTFTFANGQKMIYTDINTKAGNHVRLTLSHPKEGKYAGKTVLGRSNGTDVVLESVDDANKYIRENYDYEGIKISSISIDGIPLVAVKPDLTDKNIFSKYFTRYFKNKYDIEPGKELLSELYNFSQKNLPTVIDDNNNLIINPDSVAAQSNNYNIHNPEDYIREFWTYVSIECQIASTGSYTITDEEDKRLRHIGAMGDKAFSLLSDCENIRLSRIDVIPNLTKNDIKFMNSFFNSEFENVIDIADTANQNTFLELKTIFSNELKFQYSEKGTGVVDFERLENAIYHCTEKGRNSQLGIFIQEERQKEYNDIFGFEKDFHDYLCKELSVENPYSISVPYGEENISDLFLTLLKNNLSQNNNDLWKTSESVTREMKKKEPEHFKKLLNFFKENNISDKKSFLAYYSNQPDLKRSKSTHNRKKNDSGWER